MRFVIALVLYPLAILLYMATASEADSNIAYAIGIAITPLIITGLICIPKKRRNNKTFFKVLNVILLVVVAKKFGDVNKMLDHQKEPSEQSTVIQR